MNEGRAVDWKYKFNKDGQTFHDYHINSIFTLNHLYKEDSDVYQCCGRWKDSDYTKCSNTFSIQVSADRPRARLTAGTTTVSVGDRVTLICSVDQSDGWKYEWFRRTSTISKYRINDGENGEIRVSQGGIYSCGGFRGEPAFYSDTSDEVNINITFSNKVIVTQKPSWSQMFRGETITLTCEVQGGEGVQWEYEWRTPQSQTSWRYYKDRTITASISGEYSCRSRPINDSFSSTNWSEAVRLSVSVFTDFIDPITIDAASGPGRSSYFVLVVALTSVLLVIFLFMTWYFCNRSRDSAIIRSQINHQNTVADHNEAQYRNNIVLLHGPEEIQNDQEDVNTGESRMITYSSMRLKTFTKKKRQKPAENTVYSDVKTGASADVSHLYAEVKKTNRSESSLHLWNFN
ncbi:hypothetical protein OJAV_G00180270 [Oryzias javanicus]|uniref:Ig-like domain-containing protein n=1 Tax=Oryzias javanicus TaxID=123683 RepID=A0A437CC45_ORYJA|nr:hypothetical protein OJAV_G00180270 [Oryzias javanicus]